MKDRSKTFRAGPEVVTAENADIGLAFFSWDMRLSKIFRLGGAKSVELLFEVFNLTDHANFDRDYYMVEFSSANLGHVTAVIRNSQRQAEFGALVRF